MAYAKEQADTIVLGGLTITLPAFQKGQGTLSRRTRTSKPGAHGGRDRAADSARRVTDRVCGYEQRAALSRALDQSAAPSLADNENLARRSYEVGEMNLMDLLLIRRDAVDTRLTIIDRRLDAAVQPVDALMSSRESCNEYSSTCRRAHGCRRSCWSACGREPASSRSSAPPATVVETHPEEENAIHLNEDMVRDLRISTAHRQRAVRGG